jgi:hypothetical protein
LLQRGKLTGDEIAALLGRGGKSQMSDLVVPNCFGNVDRILRHALEQLERGDSMIRDGVIARNAAVISMGIKSVAGASLVRSRASSKGIPSAKRPNLGRPATATAAKAWRGERPPADKTYGVGAP